MVGIMADTSNPVSPKTKWALFGALILPAVAGLVATVIDALTGSEIVTSLPKPWDSVVAVVLAAVGAVIAAYRAKDGLRIPTLDQVEVDKLNAPPVDS